MQEKYNQQGNIAHKQYAMKNQIAASILRNIVAQFAGVNARQIKLEGEISPNFEIQNTYKDGSMGYSKEVFKVFGWSPETGFVQITECIGEDSSSNYAHSNSIDKNGLFLHECPNVDKYLFFVINNEGCNRWEGSLQTEWDTWTLYKAPNFQQVWDKVEADCYI